MERARVVELQLELTIATLLGMLVRATRVSRFRAGENLDRLGRGDIGEICTRFGPSRPRRLEYPRSHAHTVAVTTCQVQLG